MELKFHHCFFGDVSVSVELEFNRSQLAIVLKLYITPHNGTCPFSKLLNGINETVPSECMLRARQLKKNMDCLQLYSSVFVIQGCEVKYPVWHGREKEATSGTPLTSLRSSAFSPGGAGFFLENLLGVSRRILSRIVRMWLGLNLNAKVLWEQCI